MKWVLHSVWEGVLLRNGVQRGFKICRVENVACTPPEIEVATSHLSIPFLPVTFRHLILTSIPTFFLFIWLKMVTEAQFYVRIQKVTLSV